MADKNRRREGYQPGEYEHGHPTTTPKWLTREPTEGGRYAMIGGRAFEITKAVYLGYFIDRITTDGVYMGETYWVATWNEVKPAIRDWTSNQGDGFGEWTWEDIYGDEETGEMTAAMRYHLGAKSRTEKARASKRAYKARMKAQAAA